MGPPASTCFTVIGVALLLLRAGPRSQRGAVGLGLVVGGISLLSLIGYLFGAQPLFALADWTGIAFQTASVLFALALALVASVPGNRLGPSHKTLPQASLRDAAYLSSSHCA